ncbi:efflux RND transporter periplasmic adaptor subunit [Marinobacterium rhizophilum]|uniref:Efflux RND transporter periplasmic adaptor subunit n=1 Tax=Marinobacterium rhizophilum TaxID=420402 RepID=A0ABY5HH69_9GAMM|nr:efflux RND transporter periplasmic adaptor subunit [Marinobacterium rhizophilum]UTW11697.1 efflux RND transporter periplasmic adaptor subunit [Marinobacterium rhizophilum]
MPMRKSLLLLPLLAVLIAASFYWLRHEDPVPVALVEVARGPVELIAANSRAGTIRACRRSRLSMLQGGRVDRLLVKEGDKVKAGQVLLELWHRDIDVRIELAQATLRARQIEQQRSCDSAALALREYQRTRSLAARNLASAELLDQRKTESGLRQLSCDQASAVTDQARAALRLERVLLTQARLHAPFAGTVAQINGEPGEFITPSPPGIPTPPAVDLIDDSCLYVRAPIDEIEAARLAVGQNARITLDAFRDRVFPGQVSRIAAYVTEVEKQARTVDVDVLFRPVPDDATLLVGYSADVEIILDRRDAATRIPTETLLDGDRVLRYNADSQTLQHQGVSLGLSNWSWTEIRQGLEPGQRILQSLDREGARDGARVTAE